MLLNEIFFAGNAGRDAIFKGFNNGASRVVEFSLCYTYKGKNGDVSTWVEVKVYGNGDKTYWCDQAEKVKKGNNVFVKGRLSISEYEKDGVKRKNVEIIADTLSICSNDKADSAPKVSNKEAEASLIDLGEIPF